MKVCITCGKKKKISDFYSHPGMKDGHLNRCKECETARIREHRRTHQEHYKKYEKERYQRPERKKAVAEYQRKHRAKYKKKAIARNAVSSALSNGRIKKSACAVCGSKKVEAHHPDYNDPLNVQWLCFGCHRDLHRAEGPY